MVIKIGGQAPQGHERQCKGMRKCGLQCRRWALRGSKYCQFHGGKYNERRNHSGRKRKEWTKHIMRFYSRNLSKSLAEALEASLAQKPDDQLALFEELALVREHANNSVKLYSMALDKGSPDAVMAAGELMCIHMKQVADVCAVAAKVHNDQKDRFSIHDLNYIIEQITRISYDCFSHLDEAAVINFAKTVREQLQIAQENKGTSSTPDSIVAQMDKATLG